jgi:hypothetical protein
MAPGRSRDEEKERLWRRWIGEWQASGLSARAFGQRRGLTVASFYAWRRVLQRRAAERAAFAPVQVVADAVSTQTSALGVVLADGRTVRVAPEFDAATLRQLLAVLEGRPCRPSPRPCPSGWPWHRPTSARALTRWPSWSGNTCAMIPSARRARAAAPRPSAI